MVPLGIKRKGVIALLSIALISIAVMEKYRDVAEIRMLYAGEDVYAILLVTARYSCARRVDFQEAVRKVAFYLYPLSIDTTDIIFYEDAGLYQGRKYCKYVIFTNIGSSTSFELNYTYHLVGLRNDIGTGRITRIYRINAVQKFTLPQYNYTIVLKVTLNPLCESIVNIDGSIEIPLNVPCILIDDWGTSLLIPEG